MLMEDKLGNGIRNTLLEAIGIINDRNSFKKLKHWTIEIEMKCHCYF